VSINIFPIFRTEMIGFEDEIKNTIFLCIFCPRLCVKNNFITSSSYAFFVVWVNQTDLPCRGQSYGPYFRRFSLQFSE
jgi:hypothetical protein